MDSLPGTLDSNIHVAAGKGITVSLSWLHCTIYPISVKKVQYMGLSRDRWLGCGIPGADARSARLVKTRSRWPRSIPVPVRSLRYRLGEIEGSSPETTATSVSIAEMV